MNKRNKSYLLFLYGVWIDEKDIIRELQETLIVVIDTGYMKFVHGPGSAIVCFKSQESFEDLADFIQDSLPNYVTNHIFIPKPRKLSHRFPDDMDKHLFDVDTNTNDLVDKQNEKYDSPPDIPMNMEDFDNPMFDGIIGKIDEMFEDFVTDVKKITNKSNNFNIDDILDKITENGVSSLTKEEKDFLDKQNNQK